jgi:tRNA (guanine10-N2)-methyltransferase
MDAELSFIMTNLGQVQRSQVAFDPFVGTGSIVLSCALRGAYCIGTDIDIRVLRGRSPEENILTNFRQFDLPRPDLVRSDNGIYHRHFLTTTLMYNARLQKFCPRTRTTTLPKRSPTPFPMLLQIC